MSQIDTTGRETKVLGALGALAAGLLGVVLLRRRPSCPPGQVWDGTRCVPVQTGAFTNIGASLS